MSYNKNNEAVSGTLGLKPHALPSGRRLNAPKLILQKMPAQCPDLGTTESVWDTVNQQNNGDDVKCYQRNCVFENQCEHQSLLWNFAVFRVIEYICSKISIKRIQHVIVSRLKGCPCIHRQDMCDITDTTGNKSKVQIWSLKEIKPSLQRGVIVMMSSGYNWLLSSETGQSVT